MAATLNATVASSKECDVPSSKHETASVAKAEETANLNSNSNAEATNQMKQERLASNKKMVQKYHSMFPKIPTMTSEELVARWKEIDKLEDERDDSLNSDDGDDNADGSYNDYRHDATAPGPLLLIDVRSKSERMVSMIQGALAMDDLETTRWINKYVHGFDGVHRGGMPTIVTYCTIGYRSGREAQWLFEDLTDTFGVEIGKSVEIKNLDGILAYSFLEDAPPLLSPCRKGSSDSLMTRRIHSYGKEWSDAADPSFEVVYFDSKTQKAKHLLQTGLASAVRLVQHQIHRSKTKAKKTTTVVAKTCVEPVAKLAGASIVDKNSGGTAQARSPQKRISVTGYTSNASTRIPSEEGSH
jgi:rhodanese-related sulfurtransferase